MDLEENMDEDEASKKVEELEGKMTNGFNIWIQKWGMQQCTKKRIEVLTTAG